MAKSRISPGRREELRTRARLHVAQGTKRPPHHGWQSQSERMKAENNIYKEAHIKATKKK